MLASPIPRLVVCLPLLCVGAATPAPSPWRNYGVYQPWVERFFVNDAENQSLRYNHDSSIAWFQGQWVCLWNANEPPVEGRPGQLNYMSTSPDGQTWSPPVACFASAETSDNPVPCPKGTQWQPNLIVVGEELWAVWSQNSADEHDGAYVSRLREVAGKWHNSRLLFAGRAEPVVAGQPFRVFPTQNPVRLRSGRILAPVTLIGTTRAADAPAGLERWWELEKRDSVLYSDDEGRSWLCSDGAIQPGRSWAQWEPTVWQAQDGIVRMLARNNDRRSVAEGGPPPSEMLLCSESRDDGVTWTAHQPVSLETVCSRMHVVPTEGDRFLMVHNDWPAGRFAHDRRNLALFFTRGPGFDFVAAAGLTGVESCVAYPQAWVHEGQLLVSYSQGLARRSIKVARVTPVPDADAYYLFPRSNPVAAVSAPEPIDKALRFDGVRHLASRTVVEPGSDAFSLGTWVRGELDGVLLDTRQEGCPGGVLFAFQDGRPFLFLFTPEHNLVSGLRAPRDQWCYVGATVDAKRGWVEYVVNNQADRVQFQAPVPHPLKAGRAIIGRPALPASALPWFRGEVRSLVLHAGRCLATGEHNGIANQLATELRAPALTPSFPVQVVPVLRLDPADPAAMGAEFVLPEAEPSARVDTATVDGGRCLSIRGEASAGVDLDENERARGDLVRIEFRFRVETGDRHVLCTVGDARDPARLVIEGLTSSLVSARTTVVLGSVRRGKWTAVSLQTSGDRTAARLGDGAYSAVDHQPQATWLYLGQGYRTGAVPGTSVLLIDVESVRTQVLRQE